MGSFADNAFSTTAFSETAFEFGVGPEPTEGGLTTIDNLTGIVM